MNEEQPKSALPDGEPHTDELPKELRGTDRRAFLRTAAAVGAALCFADVKALRAAAVLARAQGKLVFTQDNFNKFIADAFKQSPTVRNQMIAESKANLQAFINKYFTLTPAQSKKLSSLTSADLQAIRNSIDNAAAQNAPMTVKFNAPPTNVPRPTRMLTPRTDGRREAIALKVHGPRAVPDEVEMTEIGKGPTVYAMKVNFKGSVSYKASGEASGTVEVSGSC
ncbi:MAG TPA: hypothetical protein VN650_10005 [Gemmatimonadaceae bacterium]|nr:hypothetical protein [Gemmatimonadaceae bacterium]